jgi:hypothetical protein
MILIVGKVMITLSPTAAPGGVLVQEQQELPLLLGVEVEADGRGQFEGPPLGTDDEDIPGEPADGEGEERAREEAQNDEPTRHVNSVPLPVVAVMARGGGRGGGADVGGGVAVPGGGGNDVLLRMGVMVMVALFGGVVLHDPEERGGLTPREGDRQSWS